jgi:prophage antirepressor-like protein
MTSLTQFAFNSQQVRIVSINNEPWFVAQDVCDILDLSNVSKACNPLKNREKQVLNLYEMGITSSNDPDTTRLLAISESGLYRLTMKSRKPQAEPFQDWVCEEILPTIRKTGKYEVNPQLAIAPTMPQNYIEALEAHLQSEKEKLVLTAANQKLIEANQSLQSEVEVLEPKAIVYDAVMDITKCVPRANAKPKVYNPFPFDTSQLTKRLIREYYPELEHRLNGD